MDIGLDLTSCNGAGFLPEITNTSRYTDNTETIDQTFCYGNGILNQDRGEVHEGTRIFGDNTVPLDITRCHGWGIQDQHQKHPNFPEVLTGVCDLDLTCQHPITNQTAEVAENTKTIPLTAGKTCLFL